METVVPEPTYTLTWQGKDISAAIGPTVLSLTYTDFAHGRSDELDIEIEDIAGKWKGSWYPSKGDVITASIGYLNGAMVPCGSFELEEFEAKGPPDVIHARALASGMSKPMRTACSKAYESTTLAQIAQQVAAKHGLTVVGQIPDVSFQRVTQNQERDLQFLKRIAAQYGQCFTVKGGQLVFAERASLVNRAPVMTLARTDLKRWNIKDKGLTTYKGAHAAYDDPWTKTTYDEQVSGEGETDDVGDTLKLTHRAESSHHARLHAQAALSKANEARYEGNLVLMGNPKLVAGNTVALTGLGNLSGTYLINSSIHQISRSEGYETGLEVRRGP